MTYREALAEQVEYQAWLEEARKFGVDTSLETNPALDTVAALREATLAAARVCLLPRGKV